MNNNQTKQNSNDKLNEHELTFDSINRFYRLIILMKTESAAGVHLMKKNINETMGNKSKSRIVFQINQITNQLN